MTKEAEVLPDNKKVVIAILDDYENFVEKLDAFSSFKAALPNADIRILTHRLPDGDSGASDMTFDVEYLVLIRERTRVDQSFLARFPALKAICQTGTIGRGKTAHVDKAACDARGVTILEGKTDGYSAAELTWALIMASMKQIPSYMQSLRGGDWQYRHPAGTIGETLRGKTLGILGYGRIGQILARYGNAFGMIVQAWGRESTLAKARDDGIFVPASRKTFFSTSDILTLHLRLNEETIHSVSFDDLQAMKTTAMLVNTSRADLLAPGALTAALTSGRPGRAAVDVYEQEPIASSHPLLQFPNVYATPHIGYVEKESYEILFASTFGELVSLLG